MGHFKWLSGLTFTCTEVLQEPEAGIAVAFIAPKGVRTNLITQDATIHSTLINI
jgi:hypothetical protein